MLIRMVLRLALSIIVVCCSCVFAEVQCQTVDAEEYAVYSTVINRFYASRPRPLVIVKDYLAQERPGDTIYQEAFQRNADLYPGLFASFESKNAEPYSLEERFTIDVPYVLLPTRECQELWKKHLARPPSGAGEAAAATRTARRGLVPEGKRVSL